MKRREFIALLASAAGLPLAAHAQNKGSASIPRIGVLWHAGSAEQEGDFLPILTKAFGDLGYFEGKNIKFEHRFPAEQPDRFRVFAKELIDSKVDIIVAVTAQGAREVKQAVTAIPTVFVIVPDPVRLGFVVHG